MTKDRNRRNTLMLFLVLPFFIHPVEAFSQAPPPPPPPPPPSAMGGARRGASSPVVMNIEFRMNILPSTFESCPVLVQMMEEMDSNNERGRTLVNGEAPIGWLANSFSLEFWKPRHARWEGALSGDTKNCVASGVVSRWNGRRVHAKDKHLQVYLRQGSMILDLNLENFPKEVYIHRAGVNRNGKPIWSWGKILGNLK